MRGAERWESRFEAVVVVGAVDREDLLRLWFRAVRFASSGLASGGSLEILRKTLAR